MYTVAVCGTRAQLREALGALRLTGRIMTAFVERVNLTLREHIPPLSRRTWSLARDEHALGMYHEWGRVYYPSCRYHAALRLPDHRPHKYRSRTPAMAAGLARRRWSVSELLLMPLRLPEGGFKPLGGAQAAALAASSLGMGYAVDPS